MPGRGTKNPHATEQVGQRGSTTEPMHHRPIAAKRKKKKKTAPLPHSQTCLCPKIKMILNERTGNLEVWL